MREWCPSTTGPLLLTMTDSLLALGRPHSMRLVVAPPPHHHALPFLLVGSDVTPVMEDSAVPSNLSAPKVPELVQAASSARAKKSPKPGEHAQLFRMKRDRRKGFYSEKCEAEASIVLCFEWDGCLVPRDVLPLFH